MRKPRFTEYLIFAMCVLMATLILFPGHTAPYNRLLTYLLFFGYAYLVLVECVQENFRYFYVWLWGLLALTMLNTRQVNEALNPEAVKLLYVVEFAILLRSIHSTNVHYKHPPLIFRRESQ